MNKHTPNWKLQLARLAKEAPIFGFSIRAEGKAAPIASAGVYVDSTLIAPFEGGYTPEEVEANARLIAAAPEMYEALKAAIESDGGIYHDGEDDGIGCKCCCGVLSYKPHETTCWVAKVEAAIAKAEGRA